MDRIIATGEITKVDVNASTYCLVAKILLISLQLYLISERGEHNMYIMK